MIHSADQGVGFIFWSLAGFNGVFFGVVLCALCFSCGLALNIVGFGWGVDGFDNANGGHFLVVDFGGGLWIGGVYTLYTALFWGSFLMDQIIIDIRWLDACGIAQNSLRTPPTD